MKPLEAVHPDATAAGADSSAGSRVTGWTSLALVAVMWIGIPWIAPLAGALPLVLEYRRADRAPLHTTRVARWVAALWTVGVILLALIGERAIRTVIFGPAAAGHTLAWFGGGAASPSWWVMIAASAVFVAATVTTRGLLGSVALAGIVLGSAVHASVVFTHSRNLVEAVVVALPLWTVAWVAGLVVALGPLCEWSRSRLARAELPRRPLAIAGALLLAAILLRFAAATPYTTLAERFIVR